MTNRSTKIKRKLLVERFCMIFRRNAYVNEMYREDSSANSSLNFFTKYEELANDLPNINDFGNSDNSSRTLASLPRRNFFAALAIGAAGIATLANPKPAFSWAATAPHARGLDMSQMDPSIRPQDDIYRYVNGRWLDSFQIPADKSSVDVFDELYDRNQIYLREIIEGIHHGNDEEMKIKRFYNSVLNTAALDAGGLKNITRQWDLINVAKTKEELAYNSGKLWRDFYFNFPINFAPDIDSKNSSLYVMCLEEIDWDLGIIHGLGIDLPFLKEARHATRRAQYKAYLSKIAGYAGLAHPDLLAEKTLNFEVALAHGVWDLVDARDNTKTYNTSSLDEIKREYSGFPWQKFIDGIHVFPENYFDRIIIDMPSYYQHFVHLWASTSLDDLKAWLTVSALRQVTAFLPKRFRDARFDFYSRTLDGVQALPPRWKTGVAVIDDNMGDALGKLYVAKYFPPEAKAQAHELINNLIATYRERLAQSWLSPSTKQAAINKLNALNTSKIGYPDHWQSYDNLVITDDYFQNYLNAKKFSSDLDIARFPHPVDRSLWASDMTPPTVNAYNNFNFNEIVFPAGILQPPFFDPTADPAVNYGGIGAVIGHEISHTFDDQGAQFDAQGNLHNWWTPADLKHFQELTRRLAAQYNAFVPTGLPAVDHINGPLSVGENAADLNGLTTAARAYRRFVNHGNINGPVSKESLQVLFCSWSRIYREKWRPAALANYVPTAEHSPGEARARQVVKNIDDFAFAFNTKPGDGEYLPPAERVHIW